MILDENFQKPILTSDTRGPVIKLPTPQQVEGGLHRLQGFYCADDASAWGTLWRLFKASLYHASLHVAYSDFRGYAPWAKDKHTASATFAVSLVEDMHAAGHALNRWPGALPDIAFANAISALRMRSPDTIPSASLRYATRLLQHVWGVEDKETQTADEEAEVKTVADSLRVKIEDATKKKGEERKAVLTACAQEVYALVSGRDRLSIVPYFPYTEAHGECDLFGDKIAADKEKQSDVMRRAYERLGLKYSEILPSSLKEELRDAYLEKKSSDHRLAKIRAEYEELVASTRLDVIEFPPGDYGMYLRVKSALAGPIRNIRDQLSLVKNVLDETGGHEGGQLDTQAAMQVVASEQLRSDVFLQEEPVNKEEAWAILLDASKSISTFSHEVKGIAACLGEVAKQLIKDQTQWSMYAFNNSFQIIKDFEEDYNITCKSRIGGLEQKNSTFLPDALTVAYKKLATKPMDVKILVVVSDGYPSGYNDIEKKLVTTIKDISRSGVLLIGVGVDSRAIQEYFTVNCVLSTPYEMMKSFVKSYLELSSLF